MISGWVWVVSGGFGWVWMVSGGFMFYQLSFVDLQDNFAMIVKPFAFFWYSSLAWLSSSFFKDHKACEYKISQ